MIYYYYRIGMILCDSTSKMHKYPYISTSQTYSGLLFYSSLFVIRSINRMMEQ